MSRLFRTADFALLLISAGSLIAGLAFVMFGNGAVAHACWTAGTLPILLALVGSVVKALRRREAGVDVLALLAIGFALGLSEFPTAAVIGLMVASGRALEQFAEQRARREMTALLSRAPRHANRFEAGEWRHVELDTVSPGDRLLVRSGEFVPVDGSLSSHAQLDESTLTGESVVRQRSPGESVSSGVVNVGAAFEMIAAASARDSTFAGIVRMVESAQHERSPATRLADRYALLFVLAALVLAGGSWFTTGDAVRALAVLVSPRLAR